MMLLPASCIDPSCPSAAKRRSKHIAKYKSRGPYRSYSTEEKEFVLRLHLSGKNFASISKELEIPQKNVVRWCREGIEGKPFNRRCSEQPMEKRLTSKIRKSMQG
jgi:transposase-like protein